MKKSLPPRVVLAFEPKDVVENVRSFSVAVASSPDLQSRLSNARAWYAVQDGNTWSFGPSKWAGYQGMTAERYLDPADGIDGRLTEKHLNKWFEFLPSNSSQHLDLLKKLGAFTAKYGKQPCRAVRISIIQDKGHENDETDELVKLLVKVAQRLNAKHQAEIIKALRS